jgi:ABC-type Fe3+-siderophore transport system permease subunit
MGKKNNKIGKLRKKNWDDIRLLLLVGIPSGIICIFFTRFIDYSNLF